MLIALLIASPVSAHDGLDRQTNAFRQDHGKRVLRTPLHVEDVAKRRARQIVDDFGHDFSWTNRIRGCAWGENIAYRIPALDKYRGRWAFNAFRDSPAHRETMLGRWHRMGSAIHLANGGMWVAQLFVRSC